MNGILLINKPEGISSFDVIRILKKELKTNKLGHTGTLDPIATGVLVILIGKATKLSDILTSEEKEYKVKVRVRIETDTLDTTGTVLNEKNTIVDKSELLEDIKSFVGYYDQFVPKYSAVKIDGKKLYEYARNDEAVSLPSRKVNIKEIKDIKVDDDTFSFTTTVSKGTYIRSLIRDICEKNGIIGSMEELVRIKSGSFKLDDCYPIGDIKNNCYKIISLDEIFNDAEEINISEEQFKYIKNGNEIDNPNTSKYYKIVYDGKLVSIYFENKKNKEKIKPLIMLGEDYES